MAFQLTVVELVLAYIAGLLTIPAMLIVFILSTEERVDSPRDIEARERMLDEAERSFYEHEGLGA